MHWFKITAQNVPIRQFLPGMAPPTSPSMVPPGWRRGAPFAAGRHSRQKCTGRRTSLNESDMLPPSTRLVSYQFARVIHFRCRSIVRYPSLLWLCRIDSISQLDTRFGFFDLYRVCVDLSWTRNYHIERNSQPFENHPCTPLSGPQFPAFLGSPYPGMFQPICPKFA